MRYLSTRRYAFAALAIFVALIMSFTLSARAQSQAGSGQVVGTTYDSSGSTVPDAKVALASKALAISRETMTNQEGQYLFVLVPIGHYSVTFTKTGFKTYKVDVEVTVGAAVTVNATLALGEVSQVVEVTANALIESTQAQPDALIGVRAIEELPINGRRFHDFVTLTPTVQIEPERNGISFAGQRGINSNITIDGADYNNPFFGGMRGGERSNNAFSIPQEAISQFQVVAYGYSSEFGRSSGGILNAVTKSGSNDWHGSAFYFFRNSDLAKENAFNQQALDSLHQVGGSLGGPIVHDKTFFFAAFEYQKNNNPRFVKFRSLDTTTKTLANGEGFDFFRSLETPFTQTNDAITGLGRIDEQFNANHRLGVRYHYAKNTALNAVATGDAILPETNRALPTNGTEGDRVNNVTATWTAIFSPRVIMETRGQFSRENRPRTPNSLSPGLVVGSGTIAALGETGTRDFLPSISTDSRVQISSNLTWNLGMHNVRFGGDYNHLFFDQFFAFNQFGVFSVSGSNVDTLLQTISVTPGLSTDHRFDSSTSTYRSNIGNALLDASMDEIALFIQDTWRVTPRFTVTAGFRWEGYVNPNPDTSNKTLTDAVRNFTSFPFGRVDPSFIPDNYRQYMPRVGFAWDPDGDGKTVIRANVGFYYARTPMLLFASPLNNFRTPPGDLSAQLPFTLPTGFTCTPIGTGDTCKTVYWQMRRIGINLDTLTLDKLPSLKPADLQAIATALGLSLPAVQPIVMANNYESPRSWQWSIGAEREVKRGWTLGADFLYANTVHLERNRDWNIPSPLVCAGVLPTGCVRADLSLRPCFGLRGGTPCSTRSRPLPGILDSLQIRESSARSRYDALTIRSVLRRTRYQLQGFYTFSYNYSDDDNERRSGGPLYENAFDLKPDYGFSRLDARHLLSVNGLIDVPGGLTVSALARFHSARPLDAVVGSDVNGDFNSTDRPFFSSGVPSIRQSFRDRAVTNVDMRVAWHVNKLMEHLGAHFREGMRMDITADFFNIFNLKDITFITGRGTGVNATYGVGTSEAGAPVPADPRFRRLRDPIFCKSAANPTGNDGCYDTNNFPGAPFSVQLGVRFQF